MIQSIQAKKRTPESYFERFEYNKYLKIMPKGLFFRAVEGLGMRLNLMEMETITRVLDPKDRDQMDMRVLVDPNRIREYNDEYLPDLDQREEIILKSLYEDILQYLETN